MREPTKVNIIRGLTNIYPIWDDNMNILYGTFTDRYDLIDAYLILEEVYNSFPDIEPKPEEYNNCPRCGLKPRLWVFDNGKSAGCGCQPKYSGQYPEAIDINSYYRKFGTLKGYDINKEDLLKSWNYYTERVSDMLEFKKYKENREIK